MSRTSLFRGTFFGVVALAVALAALPAQAQGVSTAAVSGKVIDENGAPISGAKITFTDPDKGMEYSTTTNSKGEFQRAGLMPSSTVTSANGATLQSSGYKVTVKKDALTFILPSFIVMGGPVNIVPTITLSAKGGGAAGLTDATAVKAAADARSAKQKALEQLSAEAQVSFDAGRYDESIDKLGQVVLGGKCAACYHRIAEAYVKKNDGANAELNYKKALELDPNLIQTYTSLAALYTQQAATAADPEKQQKLDAAQAMSKKANELAATGGAAGAAVFFNQGVALWNEGKAAEAQPLFEKAVAADPTMADAQYLLGMALVNQGKVQEAVKPLEAYLKLAPTGKNADTVKAVLASIKL
jgi:tetratricopeptide (TPR) repeat protein